MYGILALTTPYLHFMIYAVHSIILLFILSTTITTCGDTNQDYCDKDGCDSPFVSLDAKNNLIFKTNGKDGDVFLRIQISSFGSVFCEEQPVDCTAEDKDILICKHWKNGVIFKVSSDNTVRMSGCVDVTWNQPGKAVAPRDCVYMNGAQWYGGFELYHQRWPLNEVNLQMQPFVSQDLYDRPGVFGNILEPFWFNSEGVGIFVHDNGPLHVSVNANDDSKLCLAAYESYQHFPGKPNELKYTVCKANNVRAIYEALYKVARFEAPLSLPDLRMIKSPIWSTWARYKSAINQMKVLEFSEEIMEHGFPNSQIEIDDMFSTTYGDFDFNTDKFEDPKGMVDILQNRGFRVSVWITPFANLDSDAFEIGLKNGYWLKDRNEEVPALIKWWQGIGSILDVTNKNATDWFVARLEEMKSEYGIDSFKFDAGEITYLPPFYTTNNYIKNPGHFTRLYIDMVSRLGKIVEARCGYRSQQYPIFIRMADKDSKWGYDNGLKTLIPTALTMSVLGYPFILPDMIGGNGYGSNMTFDVVLPERELYIRWLQMSAYLPSMQFSFVPWDYDNEVVKIARNMVRAHQDVVTPILLSLETDVKKGIQCK